MRISKIDKKVASSFRDPAGFLFYREGAIYRQANVCYKEDYDSLMASGLYGALVDAGLLIPHKEVDAAPFETETAYKIIKPEPLPFVSYPYEWGFSQLKDAALTTLEIQRKALDFGMSLKDANAYNIQFRDAKPVFIDTFSFQRYRQGDPWFGYRQFCQHFLAPLALMSYCDIRLSRLLQVYLDGIPLDLASSLLPARTRFQFSLLSHIHLHAKSQKYFAKGRVKIDAYKMDRLSLVALLDNLGSAVRRLKWRAAETEWGGYYKDNNYSSQALEHKKQIISEALERLKPRSVWDLGANTGLFSRLASEKGINTVAFDMDPVAVEKNYLECIKKKESNLLPLLLDLTNPSPGIGWENRERESVMERASADLALSLALLHHLAISNNLPFEKIAGFFSRVCDYLIIEFVPKDDPQVQKLLFGREDIFGDYHKSAFEEEFGKLFSILSATKIRGSERTVYLMKKL